MSVSRPKRCGIEPTPVGIDNHGVNSPTRSGQRLRTLILTALAGGSVSGCEYYESEACRAVPESGMCLPADEIRSELVGQGCGIVTRRVLGEAELKLPDWASDFETGESGDSGSDEHLQCCYPVEVRDQRGSECVVGRPMLLAGQVTLASVAQGPAQARVSSAGPELAGIPDDLRTRLAEAWLEIARGEHASVAAFARLSLELMRFGAPSYLVDQAHAAARDELVHAALAFELASAYAGRAYQPGPMPLPAELPLAVDVAELTLAAAREGCLNETMAAREAMEAADQVIDPHVRKILRRIAADESRHAIFSWQLLKWGLARAPDIAPQVGRILDFSTSEPSEQGPGSTFEASAADELLRHGVLPAQLRDELALDSRRAVIHPCWQQLRQVLAA